MTNTKIFKKSKFIFIFLFLIFAFGIIFSLTLFSSFNLNSFSSSELKDINKSKKKRVKRDAEDKLSTEVEWNIHMVMIRPVLKILAEFNKATIIFKIGSPSAEKEYSVTNLVKAENIDVQYSAMSSEAQTELKLLYVGGIDNEKLTKAYKTELDDFFILIKPSLEDIKDVVWGQLEIYVAGQRFKVANLNSQLTQKGSELVGEAKKEFIKLWVSDIDSIKLLKAFRYILKAFFDDIKFTLQGFKEVNQTEITVMLSDSQVEYENFVIPNLISFLDKDWETNSPARQEIIYLYKTHRSSSRFKTKLNNALNKIRNQFMLEIYDVLLMLKAVNVTDADIVKGKVRQHYSWLELTQTINIDKTYDELSSRDAQKEFTKLLANKINKEKLITVYKEKINFVTHKVQVNNAFKLIKPTLKILAKFKITWVQVDDQFYQIGNLITNLNKEGSELTGNAKKEFIELLANNITEENSIAFYKNVLDHSLTIIEPALQELKKINVIKVTIDGQTYQIGNLTANFNNEYLELSNDAKKEFTDLLVNNITKEKLITFYKDILNHFLINIKPILQELATAKIAGVEIDRKPYVIEDLISSANLNTKGSKQTGKAKEQLLDLYKYSSDTQIVISKLVVAYNNLLDSFLATIKLDLQVLKTLNITEVTIDGQTYQIGNLTAHLNKKGSAQTDETKDEFINLLVNNITKEKLITFYKDILNHFLINIKPILQELKKINVIEVTIDRKPYVIEDLISSANLNTKGSKQTGKAKEQLLDLYKYSSDTQIVISKLVVAYNNLLDSFLATIKLDLQVLKTLNIIEVTINKTTYPISNLTTHLDTIGSEQTDKAKEQLLALYNYNANAQTVQEKLQIAYKNILNTFLIGIKPALQVLKTMGSTEITIAGELNSFSINNLSETGDWKTDALASQELARLYKHNSNPIEVKKELQTAYKLLLNDFLIGIKSALQVFKTMGSTEVTITGEDTPFQISNLNTVLDKNDWEINTLASQELGALYKYNSDHSVVKIKLIVAYKLLLDTFLEGIKPALQVLKALAITEVKITGEDTLFQISNLNTVLESGAWETNASAQTELITLYKHNHDSIKVNTKLISVHKLPLDTFLTNIKPALQVFKVMGSIRVAITSVDKPFQISNLITVLESGAWETNILARAELIALYKHNSDHSVVKKELQTAYKLKLKPFLKDIKPTLQFFKAMDKIEIVVSKQKIWTISNLIKVFETSNWEKNIDASKELGTLYRYKSSNLAIMKYKSIISFFLQHIKPALQVLKVLGTTEIKIAGVNIPFQISNLNTVLAKNDWEKDVVAYKELTALYEYDSDPSKVKQELEIATKKILNFFLEGIKPALQVFKAMGSIQVAITSVDKPFQISNLITVLESGAWETNILARAELIALYNHNHSVVEKELEVIYERLLDYFLDIIKPTLQKFAVNRITRVWIDKKFYLIGDLVLPINLAKKGSKQNGQAKDQLFALYKNSADAQKVKKRLNIFLVTAIDTQNIFTFQKNWDEGKVPTYLLWLPVFDIKEVKLSQNKVVPVGALANAIQSMLTAEKFDFTKLEGKARKQLLNLLNNEGKLRAEKTFQDDVWRQIKNHQKWKAIEGPAGELSLQLIKILLLKIQDLGISKVSHPFFPKGYDLSFLKDNEHWKQISFQELLQGMKVVVNGTYVEFYSHLFSNKIVFQVPMKKLSTVFSGITIINIIKALEKAISDHPQQEKKLDSNPSKNDVEVVEKIQIQKKSNISNNNLIIGLSVAGGVLTFSALGAGLYWFFKIKK